MEKITWENKIGEELCALLGEAGFSITDYRQPALSQNTGRDPAEPDILIRAANPEGKEYSLLVEVKSNGEPRMARMALQQLREKIKNQSRSYGIFGAPYITEDTGELCQKEGIGYIDAAGNVSLSFGSTYIQIKGNPNPYIKKKILKSIFAPRSSRVLRVMLSNPGKRWFVRDLAKEADVSLGQVSNVKKRLLDYEFVKERKKEFNLTEPEKLLQRWTENYSYGKSTGRNFYSLRPLRELEESFSRYCLNTGITYGFTLYAGAAVIAPFTRYNRAYAYAPDFSSPAREYLQLKEVKTGANLTILDPYDNGLLYGLQNINNRYVVCDVQLYLDLKSFGGRGEEAAKMIFQKRLKPKW
ncbi:MAG: type IV toxin-antitoxin system AbiEi family antitoxin [Candidatus Auribacterota bacterium]|nr:type IV toxin-antitoxin system AbiEi family antitoxin [Candidatus Auribacterota bacterium]